MTHNVDYLKYMPVFVSCGMLFWSNWTLIKTTEPHINEHPLLERVRSNIRLEHLLHRLAVSEQRRDYNGTVA